MSAPPCVTVAQIREICAILGVNSEDVVAMEFSIRYVRITRRIRTSRRALIASADHIEIRPISYAKVES